MSALVLAPATAGAAAAATAAAPASIPASIPASRAIATDQHVHAPGPDHVDPAPRGVDPHARLSTAELISGSGVARRPATFRAGHLRGATPRATTQGAATTGPSTSPTTAGDAAPTVSTVLDVPPGTPGNPVIKTHVSPSCSGTGVDGHRVQVLYVFQAGQTNRLSTVRTALESYIADVDDTFALSSADGSRRVRWVTDASCVPVILPVQVPTGSFAAEDGGLGAIQTAAAAANIDIVGRKLLAFADDTTTGYCGLANFYDDDSTTANLNDDNATLVGKVNQACWPMPAGYHSTAAHELMHMLGGVQSTAPHATSAGHCTDEYDVMCYADGGTVASGALATMTNVCPSTSEALYDCGHDDYFSTDPPAGSYLATHWNTAASSYLDTVTGAAPVDPVGNVSGPGSLRPGLAAVFTAGSNIAAPVQWSASAPACLTGTTTAASVTVQCPSSYSGGLRLTATFSGPTGFTSTASKLVSLSGPSAPLTVALTAPAKVYVGTAATLSTSVKYGSTPLRAVVSAQYEVLVNGAWTWRTFATSTTPRTGLATFAAPKWTSGGHYYRVLVGVASTSGWTSTVSPSRLTYSVLRTTLASSVTAGRPDVVTGVLRTSSGAAVRSQYVTLQYHYAGSSTWSYLTRRATSTTGLVTTAVQPRRGTYYRWVYSGSTSYGAVVSATRYVSY